MRRMTKIIAAIALCFAALTSCRHKELCLHHPHTVTLRVEFDWRDAPEADPRGMCVSFYSMETGGRHRFARRCGGQRNRCQRTASSW